MNDGIYDKFLEKNKPGLFSTDPKHEKYLLEQAVEMQNNENVETNYRCCLRDYREETFNKLLNKGIEFTRFVDEVCQFPDMPEVEGVIKDRAIAVMTELLVNLRTGPYKDFQKLIENELAVSGSNVEDVYFFIGYDFIKEVLSKDKSALSLEINVVLVNDETGKAKIFEELSFYLTPSDDDDTDSYFFELDGNSDEDDNDESA